MSLTIENYPNFLIQTDIFKPYSHEDFNNKRHILSNLNILINEILNIEKIFFIDLDYFIYNYKYLLHKLNIEQDLCRNKVPILFNSELFAID